MEKYVYKITNLINGKSYIGQTVDIDRRFKEHCIKHYNYISLINKAIVKYGEENFQLEELYYGEEYNEKEKYYIQKYNTLSPNGYNLAQGGENPPYLKGEEVGTSKIKNDEAQAIQRDLISGMPLKDVQKKYSQITSGHINRINNGEAWYNPIYTYPLSENLANKTGITKTSQAIHLIENTSLSLKEIGQKLGLSKSTIVNINQGKTKASKKLRNSFPLREDSISNSHLSDVEIIEIINALSNTKETMEEIGEKHGVSCTVIQGINNGSTKKYRLAEYNYPIRKQQILTCNDYSERK